MNEVSRSQNTASETIPDSAECNLRLWHIVVTQVLTPAILLLGSQLRL